MQVVISNNTCGQCLKNDAKLEQSPSLVYYSQFMSILMVAVTGWVWLLLEPRHSNTLPMSARDRCSSCNIIIIIIIIIQCICLITFWWFYANYVQKISFSHF